MEICPLCHKCLEEGEDLQLHYILCSAKSGTETGSKDDLGDKREFSVFVRFRWAKVKPCVDRIVHLISSLADSIALHWSDTEGLYESALKAVPCGKHTCQLVVGGEVIPINDIEVTESSETIYIIPIDEDDEIPEEIESKTGDGFIKDDDDPVGKLLASISSNDLGREAHTDSSLQQNHISGDHLLHEEGKMHGVSDPLELSPLYKELLQYQVIHGQPSWVPDSDGSQSPTLSDRELKELLTSVEAKEEPPHLTSQPANPQERHLKSPVPIRPVSNHEEQNDTDTLHGSQGDGTGDQRAGTRDIKEQGSRHGNQSPTTSFSTYSGSSSKRSSAHSSARQSPEITSDGANESDVSNDLQEQSLEEAIPRDSPEIKELPQPYDGKLLTKDFPQDIPLKTATTHKERTEESPRVTTNVHLEGLAPRLLVSNPPDNQTNGAIPLGFTSNQSSGGVSPSNETRPRVPSREDSVPDSRDSPVASVHSLDEVAFGSRTQESISQSITSLPYPGSLQDTPRLLEGSHRSTPVRSPPASSPMGSAFSNIRKRSSEDVRSPHLSGHKPCFPSEFTHSGTRKPSVEDSGNLPEERTPPFSSPTGSTHPLNYQRRHSDEVHSPAGSVHSSTYSKRGRSLLDGFPPGKGTVHSGVTSPPPISSLYSSARSSPRGSSPRLSDRRSQKEDFSGVIPQEGELYILGFRSRGSPTPSHESKESHRSSLPPTLDTVSKLAFSQENQSPRVSVRSGENPASSYGSKESYRNSTSRSLIDSFDNYKGLLAPGPSEYQRTRSSEKHQRCEPNQGPIIPGHFIPNSSTVFTPIYGDEVLLDVNHNQKPEAPGLWSMETMGRKPDLEAEIRRLRELNEDLKQQLLSVETAAALTERDNQKSLELKAVVASLKETDRKKDEEIERLKKRYDELEEINQNLKDEKESLQTVNKLTYEDLNEAKSHLRAKMGDMRRKTYGSPVKTYTHADQILNKSLREKVTQLESDNRELKQKYNRIKLELEQTKAEKSLIDIKLKKARSETDLRGKFDRFTSYSKPNLDKDVFDLNCTKTSSVVGNSAHRVGSKTLQDSALLNGRGTERASDVSLYSTSRQRRHCNSIDDSIDLTSDTSEQNYDHVSTYAPNRHRTLSSESSSSSLLEYEYGANMGVPYHQSLYSTRNAGEGRRERPHSYHAGTELNSERLTTNRDINRTRSSSNSPSRHESYGTTYQLPFRPVDFGSKYQAGDYGYLPARYRTSSSSTSPSSNTTGYPLPQPFCPKSASDVKLGMRVLVLRNRGSSARGIVKYVGFLQGKEGAYIGVELDNGDGKHDGSFRDVRYFKCKANRGIFVKVNKVIMCYPSD